MSRFEIHHARLGPTTALMREFLSDEEVRRSLGYARSIDRDRFVAGAGTLRVAAGRRLGIPPADVVVDRTCPDCRLPHGRPVVVGSGLGCSVSHAGTHVAVALIEGREVGIDLEVHDARTERWESLVRGVVAPDEMPPRDRQGFLRLWTRKEALLKLSGEGLRRPMTSLSLTFPTTQQSRGVEPGESVTLVGPENLLGAVVRDIDLGDDVVAAVATIGTPPDVDLVNIQPDGH